MVLIFGGSYQGKLDYAKSEFNINTIWDCRENSGENSGMLKEPDFSADCLCNIDAFVMDCVKKGIEAKEYFKKHRDSWENSIMIMTDVSSGVVPIDRDVRAMREMNGRLMVYLAGEADRVIRVFCGIGKDIK